MIIANLDHLTIENEPASKDVVGRERSALARLPEIDFPAIKPSWIVRER
ncbi:hypothetical protein RBB77_05180 [Tunturibacter psychrotolerans]|uniref:Uncharacterized protein n=1 Tax=Tunturiibacter psychrotolerans TaxID=3069686 RepID=A0AAU7ZTU4_9BACT